MTAVGEALPAGPAVLAELRGNGLRLSVGFDDRLLVGPQASITQLQDTLIRSNKVALIDALRAEQQLVEELKPRIREMAQRWHYTEDEVAEAQAAAAGDPRAWLQFCQMDEEAASKAERVGRRYPW